MALGGGRLKVATGRRARNDGPESDTHAHTRARQEKRRRETRPNPVRVTQSADQINECARERRPRAPLHPARERRARRVRCRRRVRCVSFIFFRSKIFNNILHFITLRIYTPGAAQSPTDDDAPLVRSFFY